ncbi:MAG: PP2C family protein-serine/threonine phosphatase [Candidatus Brocadiia bacterium]
MGKSDEVDAQRWALEQAIRRRLQRDPGWQVRVHDRDWLCPYCGGVGVSPYRKSRAPADILRHFVQECPEWSQDRGTQVSHVDLEARARRLELDESLRTDPAWRVADDEGRWTCPYCAEPTPIRWPLEDSEAAPPVEAVLGHLDGCQPCRDRRKPLTAEALQLIARDAQRYRRLTRQCRRKIEESPAWRQATAQGAWVCPQCRQPVPEVDISSDLLLVSTAPAQMARHLMDRCGRAGPAEMASPQPQGEPAGHERNLERAREIVHKMLPAQLPPLESYDLFCLYRPTESVGGDFYDYFPLSSRQVALLIGDVAGHGLEAALIMTMVKKSLKLHAQHHRSPAEVLRRTNDDINADLDARTFVSACYAVLDPASGTLSFARAGHNRPILFNPQRRQPVRRLESKGIALGMYQGGLFDTSIQETEIRLQPGDAFLLYTDGLVEARNPGGEPYGPERLEAALNATHGDLGSQSLAGRLFEGVRRFTRGAPQEDDVAILCLTALTR